VPDSRSKSGVSTSCLAYQPCATAAMTDDTPLPFDLPSVRRKKLAVDFAGGNQSSNGGVLLLREAERKHGVSTDRPESARLLKSFHTAPTASKGEPGLRLIFRPRPMSRPSRSQDGFTLLERVVRARPALGGQARGPRRPDFAPWLAGAGGRSRAPRRLRGGRSCSAWCDISGSRSPGTNQLAVAGS
jgi:hypothetical protein